MKNGNSKNTTAITISGIIIFSIHLHKRLEMRRDLCSSNVWFAFLCVYYKRVISLAILLMLMQEKKSNRVPIDWVKNSLIRLKKGKLYYWRLEELYVSFFFFCNYAFEFIIDNTNSKGYSLISIELLKFLDYGLQKIDAWNICRLTLLKMCWLRTFCVFVVCCALVDMYPTTSWKILLYVVICERRFYFKYLNLVYAYNGMIQSTSTISRHKADCGRFF